ncbi:serine/threonine-protein kinase PknK [Sorangium cellulosum]|uniref:serine/threonine-protein kinase n=1 Tax=Sorangium cellulosum TaxID=56 RepID=UPI003D9A55AD
MIVGDLVAQRYLIERVAAQGGMGRVYRALDRHTGRPVAVKVLDPEQVDAPRFRREATLLAELLDPRIVRYVDHGETTAGEPYLAMEWLDGEDLASRLRRGQALGVAESVRLARRAAEALDVAHARGVVHRDVKPGNLFLVGGRPEEVKVIDFGIALVTTDPQRVTRTGASLGTLGYMAPEQARGERALSPRVDVFALGCVLFECLAGRPPFPGDLGLSILARILIEQAPRVAAIAPGIPPALDDLVARMLAKHAAERPRDGREVAEALAALADIEDAPARAAPGPALTHGEQRVVCVLLVQPRMAATVDIDAPTVPMQNEPQEAAPLAALAEAHGARLHPVAGGALVSTLAGSGAATDQAARAARFALALRAALPLSRIALCTGQCAVGDRAPTGEAIDRAAHLLARARPAEADAPLPVLLDDPTAALLAYRFDARAGPLGIELHDKRAPADTARTVLGRATPFVGRERELAMLEALVDEVRSEGAVRAVLVTAPPGVGKSRLRRELSRRLRTRGEPHEIWLGRGEPMRSGAPFAIIADALRSGAEISREAPVEERRRRLFARVARRVAPGDARRVAEFLGEVAGVPFPPSVELVAARSDPQLMNDHVARAFRDLLAAETEAALTLLVLEDLHWGDLPSVKLVDAMLRGLSERPLVVLALARPEIAERFPRLWSERALVEVRLGAVSRRASERLVRAVAGGAIADEAVARIVARAAGNLLYLEELVRAEVSDRGDALPETVLAMVQARLSAFGDEARRVLRAASVFGLEFRITAVAALLRARVDDVACSLDELCEREVVIRLGHGRSEARLAFGHALFREAAYASLTPADRALGHRLAAAWLLSAGEHDALVLAEHYERGELLAEAARSYRLAAEQALRAGDLATALVRAERGAACGAAGEDLGALRCVQAEVHEARGERAAAGVRAFEAVELLAEGTAPWLHAAALLIDAWSHAGRIDDVIAWLDRLGGHAPVEREAAEALARALLRGAATMVLAGRPDVADAALAHARVRAAPLAGGAPLLAAHLEHARGMRSMYRGDLADAYEAFSAAAGHRETIGDWRRALRERSNAALALMELGEDAEAEALLRGALSLADRVEIELVGDYARAYLRQNLGRVLRQRGDLAEARALAERALAELGGRGAPAREGGIRQSLAETLAAAGDLERALGELSAALDLLRDFQPLRMEVLGAQADVLLRAGRVAEALAAAREGARLLQAECGGMGEGESRLRLVLVLALDAAGEAEEARAALGAAVRSLLARAARIRDPRLRRSFLERVPENARTLALARERLGVTPPA